MKRMMMMTLALAAVLAVSTMTVSAQDAQPLTEKQTQLIKENVLDNLDHNSMEVRAGTMQLLIELKDTYPTYDFSYAVLPMMETLKHDEKPEFRILAALALYHLDSDLGRFAVERRAKFDDNPRVARHCSALVRNWGQASYTTDLIAEAQREL